MRRLAALLLLLGAAACAAPPPVREAPVSYPASVRERILRIAEAEWREWGGLVAGPGRPRLEPGAEGSTDSFPRVLAYWRAVPEAEAAEAIARNRARWSARLAGDADAAIWSEPAWSAAFVSYVMRGAGVDEREFHASASHAFYLDAILRDAIEFPAQAPFLPHEPAGYAPRLGDLVCADRSARPLASWRDRLAETGKFRPMHCDIVLRVSPGLVEAVGGNIADAVTLTGYAADAAGRVLSRPAGEPVIFAVIENRLGRLPPFAPGTIISARR
ncbi:DUF2272 domain-containing protein [Roseomonas xinghualingensis]|uniref:DUF2272 domain-containing protein n=1 Tax=Roseomonas xinghualingensis TaxID=2986475 RepID=UPI0021F101CA|nr:DUF2272 domain-containing protein [Roseomonas sp. SXEYE001]MCV4206397.1 DUF2272 domain-containing protein [Roseomonas sp. SXEYE001]